MNNKFFLAVLFCMGSVVLMAQQEQTLAGSARVRGGFGGPFFVFSNVDGEWGGGAGGGGGFILNDMFFGGFGQGESFGNRTINGIRYNLSLGQGGLWIGYVKPSHKLFHLYATAKIGWGGVNLTPQNVSANDVTDDIFVLTPEAGVEVNVLHWFRIAATGGYRVVTGVNQIEGYKNRDFSSPIVGLTLRFGGFGL